MSDRCPDCGAAMDISQDKAWIDSYPKGDENIHHLRDCWPRQLAQLDHANWILTEKLAQKDGMIAELLADNDRLTDGIADIASMIREHRETELRSDKL